MPMLLCLNYGQTVQPDCEKWRLQSIVLAKFC